MIAIRATLNDAIATETIDLIATELDNLDDVMKSLGVAESALKKQQQVSSLDDWGYTGGWVYDGPSSAFRDQKGDDYGGYGYASPTIAPKRTP